MQLQKKFKILGDFVRGCRGKDHQVDFSKKLKISQPRLSKIEQGVVTLSLDMAYRLYKYAKIKPVKIFEIYEKQIEVFNKESKNVSKKKVRRS